MNSPERKLGIANQYSLAKDKLIHSLDSLKNDMHYID
jgi:hypothetical protein